MIVVMNRIPVNPKYWEEFEESFKNRERLVDKFPGFIRNVILRPLDDTSSYHVVMTFWRSKEDFIKWTESEEFRKAHSRSRGRPDDFYAGKNVFEMYEIVTDTDEESS